MGRRAVKSPRDRGYCVEEYSPLHNTTRFCATNISKTEAHEHRAIMEITYPENRYSVVPVPKTKKEAR